MIAYVAKKLKRQAKYRNPKWHLQNLNIIARRRRQASYEEESKITHPPTKGFRFREIGLREASYQESRRDLIELEAEFTRMWMRRRAGDAIFEVRHINLTGDKHVVNLETNECSCRKWILTGIPCSHAISCMRLNNINPEDLVPNYYRKETYAACYAPIIYPARGSNLWETTPYTDLQLPPIKRQPGRPKKKRNKDPSELIKENGGLRKTGMPQRCSKCQQNGHNRATCLLPPPLATRPVYERGQSSAPTSQQSPVASHPTQQSAAASQPTQQSAESSSIPRSEPEVAAKRKYTQKEKGKEKMVEVPSKGKRGRQSLSQPTGAVSRGIVINEPGQVTRRGRPKLTPIRPNKN